jgi:hypothetical protein
MQQHLEFQIVTPRTLAEFRGQTLVLPDVRVLGDDEKAALRAFAAAGSRLVITGTDATGLGRSNEIIRFPVCPGKTYNAALEKGFDSASPDSERAFLRALKGGSTVMIDAGPLLATSIARTADGHIKCFFANFAGLRGGANPIQTPQNGVTVTVHSKTAGKAYFLPFLGTEQMLNGSRKQDATVFPLPPITKGAVFSFEQ